MEGNPGLSKLLHEEGGRGLSLFGYEPERSLRASDGFQCTAERELTCPKPPPLGFGFRPPRHQEPIKRKNVEVGFACLSAHALRRLAMQVGKAGRVFRSARAI